MLQFSVNIDNRELSQLTKDMRIADKAALRTVATKVVIPAMQLAVSHAGGPAPIGRLGSRTGRLRKQIRLKLWTGRDGVANGAVRVIGDRAHISRFNEGGTKSHGRNAGPLPARKMFETVGRTIRSAVEAALKHDFEQNMKALGYK